MKRIGNTAKAVIALSALAILIVWRAGAALRLAFWALIAAYLADIPVSALEKRVGRSAATVLVFLSAMAILAGTLCAVLIPMLSQLGYLPLYWERAGATVERLTAGKLTGVPLNMDGIVRTLSGYAASILSKLALTLSGAAAGVTHVAAVCALAFFYLLDWSRIRLRLALFVPGRVRPRAMKAYYAVRRELGMYLRGQLTVMAAMSALTTLALALLGSPAPLPLGILYGALNAIPYFGPFVATVPPVFAALAAGWKPALLTLIALLVIQQIDNYVLSPRVMGAVSGAGPAAVLLSIAVGSALAGVWGMFLALPVLTAARAVYQTFANARTEEDGEADV